MNEAGIKLPLKPKATIKKELPIPAELAIALKKNKNTAAAFNRFTSRHRNEYVTWIALAKTAVSKEKRIATTIERINRVK